MHALSQHRSPRSSRLVRSPIRSFAYALGATVGVFAATATAEAAPVWIGDFETGDVSQWNNALNGSHIGVVTSPVVQGTHAARIELTNDAVWPNGLKRVELHHSPSAGRTAEGAETWFAWSFYLPATLPTSPSQQIGYWESDQSYHQIMAFNVAGEHVQFITQLPQYKVQWEADGMATAGKWHRIAMHVGWSTSAANGVLDVWYDGTQVVNHVNAPTLADANSAFTQVGLLRGAVEFQDTPVIFLDDAVEGDSLADVHPDLPMNPGTGGAGGATGSTVGSGATTSAVSSGATTTSGAGGSGTGGSGGGGATDGGCGCRTAPAEGRGALGVVALFGLGMAARRKRRASDA